MNRQLGAVTPGEAGGIAIYATATGLWLTLIIAAMTGTIDDLILWVFGPEFLRTVAMWAAAAGVGAVVVVGMRWSSAADRMRVHFRPDPHNHHDRLVIRHEALGHAAVARGVGAKSIRARVNEDGSGWVECDRAGLSLAAKAAITAGGEHAAGPAGCSADRARFQWWMRQAPRQHRGHVAAEAHRIANRHVGNAFGHKVARALQRNGRYR